jgi:histidyl-tRNA synthetase
MITRVRGTRDILDLEKYNFVFNLIRNKLKCHNFIEIHTPIIEKSKLFTKSLGNETDIITKEMFFVTNKNKEKEIENNEDSICLRPEGTASTIRSYIENQIQKTPWRAFSYGPMFRYERPQKGRYREFFQNTIEIINAESLFYDIELIVILNNIFKDIGLEKFSLDINFIGTAAEREKYKVVLFDYFNSIMEKIPEEYHARITKEKILRLLDCKDLPIQAYLKEAPILESFLSDESLKKWHKIQNTLITLNINYSINYTLVRGLDYYNDTVFEFKSNMLGAQNAFCGGGRYDGLATLLESKEKIPSVGAGIGIDRLILLLEEQNKIKLEKKNLISIIVTKSEYFIYAIKINEQIIKANLCSEIYFDKNSLKSALRKSNSEEASIACIIGDAEFENKSASIKLLNTGEQALVQFEDIVSYCKNLLL